MTDEGSGASVPDVDELVTELRARVEQRQREGRYPTELTDELRQHFERIARHRAAVDLDVLRRQLDVLDNASSFDASRIPLGSGMPGGQKLHAAVAKLVSRQTQGALEQVQAFADATRVALRTVLLALEEPHGHVHEDLVGQVDSLFERLAAFERGPDHPAAAVADLRERVEALEHGHRPAPPLPAELRGERHYDKLVAHFEGVASVVHVGARDESLVGALVAAGIEVATVDAASGLASLPDDSVEGLLLDAEEDGLVELILLARDKVRPGGRVVVDGRNPESVYGLAQRPSTGAWHPAHVEFLLREAGLAEVHTAWRSEPPDDELLDDVEDKAMNENVRRLNRLLFAPQDYAVVATR